MSEQNFDNDEVRSGDGSGADASGPQPPIGPEDSENELYVDDILAAAEDSSQADAAETAIEVDLLNDLKRVQAEYANYRRRSEEQRQLDIERAKGQVAKDFLPVLDDLDRAEKHGDLVAGTAFAVIAEKIRASIQRLGVESYGVAGEAFDPQQHEAIVQVPTPGATEATIAEVVEVGYRLGGVELRPAKVVVAVPAE